jgi:hypothetical protein
MTAPARVAPPRGPELLELDAHELVELRWDAGRRASGLAPDAPFALDRPELVGLDELEELVDAAIHRRERYRLWYGSNPSRWPPLAVARLAHAIAEVEALRLELRYGPRALREA